MLCSRIEKKVQHCSTFFPALEHTFYPPEFKLFCSYACSEKNLADFSTRAVKNSEWKTALKVRDIRGLFVHMQFNTGPLHAHIKNIRIL